MSKNIIEVENLSKLYKLGSLGSGTFSHDLNRWWSNVRKKEDTVVNTAKKNDRSKQNDNGYVWSLKDINFEVKEGEIFGIIGGNGAGKSTLLKILSKITKPTKGSIKLDGRVASLLEVGTGFHPELTGRENVFLNGAILGMRKQEIKSRFDEIVEFSGIGRYIDTPVKKYSSGMYVRLAFAVAAYLDPDILIIDEVLAVGDAEFQAKCIGKMKDVALNEGRTVLFVSHSIAAIKQLCNKALLLEHGMQKSIGDIKNVIAVYQQEEIKAGEGNRNTLPFGQAGYFKEWELEGKNIDNKHTCHSGDTCIFSFGFYAAEDLKNCEVRFTIKYEDLLILHASSLTNNGTKFSVSPGYYKFKFKIDLPVRDARFDISAYFFSFTEEVDAWASSTKLTILDNFESPVISGMINPVIQFSMKESEVNILT